MIQLLAVGCLLIAAGWLACIAAPSFLSPDIARRGLARMGSSRRMDLIEHVPRAVVGLAMVVRATASKAPTLFTIGGWFLIVTSVLILLAPRGWHHAYAVWWAERIPLWAYRLLALPTLLFAAAIAYASL